MDHVSDSVLDNLYKNCLFTVFPSFAEGWGLGAVESLLHKKICIISTCPALREATQSLCHQLDPTDTCAWVEMILKLLNSEERKRYEG